MVKILNSNYAKADLEQVFANSRQLNSEKKLCYLSLSRTSRTFFDGTLGDWATETVEL